MADSFLRILKHEPVGSDAFLLRLERPDWLWSAGQLVSLSGADEQDQRDYTIASGENDDTLDVLYRLIPHGVVTPFLKNKQPGDRLNVQGPYGRFTLRDVTVPIVFAATGTGIAPCRAFLRTHPTLKLTLFHGVRIPEDLYFESDWKSIAYHPCCSQSPFKGETRRITELLKDHPVPSDAHVYLCGANEMIYEVEALLKERGLSGDRIFREPYYYRAYDA